MNGIIQVKTVYNVKYTVRDHTDNLIAIAEM